MPNVKKFLLCRCSFDDETKYFYYWTELLIKEAEKLGIEVIELRNEYFSKENFEKAIKEHDPFFIFAGSHGESNILTGNNYQIVIEACKNDILLKDRIIYTIACQVADILGQSSYDKGCSSFIGYREKLILGADPNPDVNPLDDKYVRGFMEASNQLIIMILKGKKPEIAIQEFYKTIDTWINKYEQLEADDPLITEAISYLLYNKTLLHSFM